MKTTRIEYPFEVRPLSKDEGGGYAITFPDLPGCRSDGATPEEAIENGRDALQSWLAVECAGQGVLFPLQEAGEIFSVGSVLPAQGP
jgi:antitoxin HicB